MKNYYSSSANLLRWVFKCFKEALDKAMTEDNEDLNNGTPFLVEVQFSDTDYTNNNKNLREQTCIQNYSSPEDFYEQAKEFAAYTLKEWAEGELKHLKGGRPQGPTFHFIKPQIMINAYTKNGDTKICSICGDNFFPKEHVIKEINSAFSKENISFQLTTDEYNDKYPRQKNTISADEIQKILDAYPDAILAWVISNNYWSIDIQDGNDKSTIMLMEADDKKEFSITALNDTLFNSWVRKQDTANSITNTALRSQKFNIEETDYNKLTKEMRIERFLMGKLKAIQEA